MENESCESPMLAPHAFDIVGIEPPSAELHFVRRPSVAGTLPPAASRRRRHGLSRRSLNRACEFMSAHLGEHLTLDDLAQAACVSRSHFARLFRVSMGTSPIAYLFTLRVERAKHLLDGRQRISDVAIALGFCDQSHFSRVFRRLTGITPKYYAQIHGRNAIRHGATAGEMNADRFF